MIYSSEKYYEDIFINPFEELTMEEKFESLRSPDIFRYRVKTIRSGKMLECEIFPIWSTKAIQDIAKKATSSLAQANLNDANAKKAIVRTVNTNFDENDMWLTYGYDDKHLPETEEQAHRDIVNCLNRIKIRRKKLGLPPLRYVYVTEFVTPDDDPVRCHHHIVMSGDMDRDEIEKIWKCGGRTNSRRLQPDDFGLTGLAKYISKTSRKGKKRWGCSVGLKKPKITSADHKITKRQVEKIASNENAAPALFEKCYPGYKFLDIQQNQSEFVPGAYLYVRMKKDNKPVKNKAKNKRRNI